MAVTIRRVEYFNTTVSDRPGAGYQVLAHLASEGISLVAYTGVPVGVDRTQLTLFPEEPSRLSDVARRASMEIDGPHFALLVQGDDELGAVASIHERIYHAGINIYGSSGVADGHGSFGYLVYVAEKDFEAAAQALGV